MYKPISKFPAMRRDVSILAPKSLTYEALIQAIQSQKPKRLKDIFMFDYYESESLGDDKKSIGLGLIYQDPEKTMTTEEVDAMHTKLWGRIQAALPITIR